jgi:hypothetical protein
VGQNLPSDNEQYPTEHARKFLSHIWAEIIQMHSDNKNNASYWNMNKLGN